MKRSLLSLLTFGLFGAAQAAPIELARLADCIAQVEGASTRHIGKAGERSRFQITRAVWEQHSRYPFESASSPWAKDLSEQYYVVIRHLTWLQAHVERPTVFRIAAAWNAGAGAVNRGAISDATFHYADRVRNLYNEEDEE